MSKTYPFRASGCGKLMAYPDKDKLPTGAISYIQELASQIILDWRPRLDTRAIENGLACEEAGIALLNEFRGANYIKNSQRITTDLLTGEWDIFDAESRRVIDIKNAYSKATFPMFLKDGDKKLYEWQLTAYMHLINGHYGSQVADNAEIVYTLVDTPEELISQRDDISWHQVSHIPAKDRITVFGMKYDQEREEQLIARCKLGQAFLHELLDERGYNPAIYEVNF